MNIFPCDVQLVIDNAVVFLKKENEELKNLSITFAKMFSKRKDFMSLPKTSIDFYLELDDGRLIEFPEKNFLMVEFKISTFINWLYKLKAVVVASVIFIDGRLYRRSELSRPKELNFGEALLLFYYLDK